MGKGRANDFQKMEDLEKRVKLLETPKSELEPVVTDQIKGQLIAMPIDAALVTLVLALVPTLPAAVAASVVVVVIHVITSLMAAYKSRQMVVPTAKL